MFSKSSPQNLNCTFVSAKRSINIIGGPFSGLKEEEVFKQLYKEEKIEENANTLSN